MLRTLRRLERWLFGDPPDPAWTAQRPIPRFTGYDEARATAAWIQARRGVRCPYCGRAYEGRP